MGLTSSLMNLAVDIGNTNIKAAVFAKNELRAVCMQTEELEALLSNYKIKHAIISKTGENHEIKQSLKARKISVLELSHGLKLPIELLYKTPETLGADRIAGSVGAKAVFPDNPVLKIDFGTCITYDFINDQSQYLGGAISPGMMMRFKALHNYTAKLPLIDPMQFKQYDITGTDTGAAIASGVMNGIKNEVTGIINDYESRFAGLKVVATGGDSGLFVTLIKSEIFARPYLVLEGLNTILNNNM
jgi:type III pantothenate kinase